MCVSDIIFLYFVFIDKILFDSHLKNTNLNNIKHVPANIYLIIKGVVPIKNKLSTKLKKLRIRSGLTQAQLADKLNVSASAIGMYEQGRREPDSETLSKICRTLDASGDYILDLENPNSSTATTAEVYSVISNFISNLENQEGLTFNGTPINKNEKEKIASALKIATAVTLSDMNCDL